MIMTFSPSDVMGVGFIVIVVVSACAPPSELRWALVRVALTLFGFGPLCVADCAEGAAHLMTLIGASFCVYPFSDNLEYCVNVAMFAGAMSLLPGEVVLAVVRAFGGPLYCAPRVCA